MLTSSPDRGLRRSAARRAVLVAAALAVAWAARAGVGSAAPAAPDHQWPSTQANLGLEADGFDSWSSAKAVLPPHVVIGAPAAGTPRDLREYSGPWSGWMCSGRTTDLKVAFTRVARKAATAVIAWAGGDNPPGSATLRLSLSGDEMRSNGAAGLYKFRLRTFDDRVGVQTMDVMVVRSTGSWCAGVLRKDTPG